MKKKKSIRLQEASPEWSEYTPPMTPAGRPLNSPDRRALLSQLQRHQESDATFWNSPSPSRPFSLFCHNNRAIERERKEQASKLQLNAYTSSLSKLQARHGDISPERMEDTKYAATPLGMASAHPRRQPKEKQTRKKLIPCGGGAMCEPREEPSLPSVVHLTLDENSDSVECIPAAKCHSHKSTKNQMLDQTGERRRPLSPPEEEDPVLAARRLAAVQAARPKTGKEHHHHNHHSNKNTRAREIAKWLSEQDDDEIGSNFPIKSVRPEGHGGRENRQTGHENRHGGKENRQENRQPGHENYPSSSSGSSLERERIQQIATWLAETIGYETQPREMLKYVKHFDELGCRSIAMIVNEVTDQDLDGFTWMALFHKRVLKRQLTALRKSQQRCSASALRPCG